MPKSQRVEPIIGYPAASDGGPGGMKEGLIAFLANPGAYDYTVVSVNLCRVYSQGGLSQSERQIAEDILRKFSKSFELQVRKALSEHLKHSGVLPHDIALTLAHDVETIALPMIQYSEVLTDTDLIEIVRGKDEAYQTAVARREQVSEAVSDAVIETGNEDPVLALVSNEGAEISDAGFDNVVRLFPASDPIKEALAERPDLPLPIVEKLVDQVSEHLSFELISRHATSADLIERLMQQGSEGATIALLSSYEEIAEAEILAGQLFRLNRLTPTLLLRSLYCGQLDFFEFGIARLAQVSVEEARTQIHSGKPYAFQRLYKRAQLPAQLFMAYGEALGHLTAEIAELDGDESEALTRRVVSPLIRRKGFDKQQFEAALLMAGAR